MDIFDILKAVLKRKTDLIHAGMNENEALIKAEFDVSQNYRVLLRDVKKLIGQ